jgi:hypothetical protein
MAQDFVPTYNEASRSAAMLLNATHPAKTEPRTRDEPIRLRIYAPYCIDASSIQNSADSSETHAHRLYRIMILSTALDINNPFGKDARQLA